MLTREQAQEQLKQFELKDIKAFYKERLETLPSGLRNLAEPLLKAAGIYKSNDHDWTKFYEAVRPLDRRSKEDRKAIFTALFPKLANEVESAWQLKKTLSYQTGYSRRSFRAPNNEELSLHNRAQWLQMLLRVTQHFNQDVTWYATWTPYLNQYQWGGEDILAYVFAAAINGGNNEVFTILKESGSGTHDIGSMGRHVTRALITANKTEGWEYVEKLLLAAQRQEGLRQVVLETIDEAHPEAYKRMLKLIKDENLTRFAAVIRGVDVWFGFNYETGEEKKVNKLLEQVIDFLENPSSRHAALNSDDAETTYLALWASAFEDAVQTIELAKPLLNHPKVEVRYVATNLLAQLDLSEAKLVLVDKLEDEDFRVALRALDALSHVSQDEKLKDKIPDMFERLERLITRMPSDKKLPTIVWSWTGRDLNKSSIARMLSNNLGKRPIAKLFPYLDMMDSYARRSVVTDIGKKVKNAKDLDAESRDKIIEMMGDSSNDVREEVLKILAYANVTEEEVKRLEPLLSRKAGDLRRGVIGLILKQSDDGVFQSAERLMSRSSPERQAGIEILNELKKAKRSENKVKQIARGYESKNDNETQLLETILETVQDAVTLEAGLGLYDPNKRTPPIMPKNHIKGIILNRKGRTFISSKTPALIKALDTFVHEQRETPVTVSNYAGSEEQLLGNLQWGFWQPFVWKQGSHVPNENEIPLRELWESWWNNRPANLRDEDGFESLRTLAALQASEQTIGKGGLLEPSQQLYAKTERSKLKHEGITSSILQWFAYTTLTTQTIDFLLDAAETCLALAPKDMFMKAKEDLEKKRKEGGWYSYSDPRSSRLFTWFNFVKVSQNIRSELWTNEQTTRYWGLLRTLDEGFEHSPRLRPEFESTLQAWKFGAANDNDIYDYLIGQRGEEGYSYGGYNRWTYRELNQLSGHKPAKQFETYPELKPIVESIRTKLLEIELKRADLPTFVSVPTMAIRSVYGVDYVVKILTSLGKEKLVRGYTYDGLSKSSVFSSLLRASFPKDGETPELFAEKVKATKISEQRLLDLAMYAPQWSKHVAHTLGWEGLGDAVFWFHAHTKDRGWTVDQEVREVWNAEVSERTPLNSQSLMDGAVDVAWFNNVYNTLGKKRWEMLDESAQYTSGGGGHKRAQLFANALLGKEKVADVAKRVTSKRSQDALRALGLIPLAADDDKHRKEVLERYKIIQTFLRESKKFGSQRQASEKLASLISMENLARTAGYADPQRLTWAMEAEAIADLAQGPISVTSDEVTVVLSIDAKGEPQLDITKKGKALKDIPGKLKKVPEIAELRERKSDIGKQTSRMRSSLEESMIRGDLFTTGELKDLFKHPVLKPMLESLVFMTEDGAIGYPKENGALLKGMSSETVLGETKVRLAHSHDLLNTDNWHTWQQECFTAQRQQPFKQIFRELYVVTNAEREAEKRSQRYEGHQVNPRQALALLGSRGWVAVPEEGVRKTFHQEGLSAWLNFHEGFYTPADIDGLTIDNVMFSKRGEWQPLPLDSIPPRLFSETMRDLDLVVSVAHRGGVDPEASASTVEMRSALLRETLGLLKIENVRLERSHALIAGDLGNYTVHLGSANVHRQPGGSLCIIPVGSQHRGRIFLPFADDDPKTAEVVSKVLLLAEDKKIQDPTILEQLR
jgi:HEAT repeat protein